MTLGDKEAGLLSPVSFKAPCHNEAVPGDDQARVQAWVAKETYRRLRLLAVDRDTSVAEVVRQLLDQALERLEKDSEA